MLVVTASCGKEQSNTWNEATETFEMPAYNLEWNLSGIDGIKLIPSEQEQPTNKLFSGMNDVITYGLLSFEAQPRSNAFAFDVDNSDNFINTVLPAELLKVGYAIDSQRIVKTRKCEYLSHPAVTFSAIMHGATEHGKELTFWGLGYIVEIDGRIFISYAIAPVFYLEKYDSGQLEEILNRLSYIE